MPRVSSRNLLLALLLAASVAFLLHALRGPKAARPPVQERVAESESGRRTPRSTAEGEVASAAPADADFGRYAALARIDLFSKQRTPPKKQTTPLPPPPPLPKNGNEKPPARKIDFAGWTYVGYIALDGKELGILQNDTTHTCEYLAVGDKFLGATVEALDRESMKLKSGRSRTTLSRPRDFSVVPLDTAAAARPPRPQPRS
jgi:hypothetical protein